MPSYIPEHVHGLPWPKVLHARECDTELTKKGERYCNDELLAALMFSGVPSIGADLVARVAVRITDARAIGAAIDRLITMLDMLEPDPDLEPYLAGFDGNTDDTEGEDEHGGDIQDEPHDAEEDHCVTDKPHDGETDICESLAPIPGGGSVSQHEDGWRTDPNHVPPVTKPRRKGAELCTLRETARRLPSGDVVRSYGWNAAGVGNLPPEAFEGMIPEIIVARH